MTWFAWNDESAFSVPLLLGPEAIAWPREIILMEYIQTKTGQ
jgi:hypothetical protein